MNLHKTTMPHEILVYEMFVNRMSNGHITLIAPVLLAEFCHAGQAISKKTLRVLAESLQVFDQNSHFLIVYTTKHI